MDRNDVESRSGLDRVSAGCEHCYAMTLAKRLKAMGSANTEMTVTQELPDRASTSPSIRRPSTSHTGGAIRGRCS